MTDTLLSLAERCERAEGPDRELDCLIGVAIGRFFTEPNRGWPDRLDYVENRVGGVGYPGHGFDQLVPNYTASIDAALTLVPVFDTEDGPRPADYILEHVNGGLTIGARVGHNDPDRTSWAASDALALCAAAMKARASMEGQTDG